MALRITSELFSCCVYHYIFMIYLLRFLVLVCFSFPVIFYLEVQLTATLHAINSKVLWLSLLCNLDGELHRSWLHDIFNSCKCILAAWNLSCFYCLDHSELLTRYSGRRWQTKLLLWYRSSFLIVCKQSVRVVL